MIDFFKIFFSREYTFTPKDGKKVFKTAIWAILLHLAASLYTGFSSLSAIGSFLEVSMIWPVLVMTILVVTITVNGVEKALIPNKVVRTIITYIALAAGQFIIYSHPEAAYGFEYNTVGLILFFVMLIGNRTFLTLHVLKQR